MRDAFGVLQETLGVRGATSGDQHATSGDQHATFGVQEARFLGNQTKTLVVLEFAAGLRRSGGPFRLRIAFQLCFLGFLRFVYRSGVRRNKVVGARS